MARSATVATPADLMILNEPETSLHQDLLAPLARLIAGAASRS
jgi:predicted ATPase